MARDGCLARVAAGAAVGGAIGGAVGAVYGTYEAIRFKIAINTWGLTNFTVYNSILKKLHDGTNNGLEQVPGLLKVRYIGQTTLGSAAVFGLFLGAGSLIHCGKSY